MSAEPMPSVALPGSSSSRERHRPQTREDAFSSRRGRLLDAVATAVAELGYTQTTISDIVARAAVSKRTFYEHFRDKQECFLAAYDVGVDLLIEETVAATPLEGDWRTALRQGLRAYLRVIADEPDFARACLVEIYAAGPTAIRHRYELISRFAAVFGAVQARARKQDGGVGRVPESVLTAAAGGVYELVTAAVLHGGSEQVLALEDEIMAFLTSVLAPPVR